MAPPPAPPNSRRLLSIIVKTILVLIALVIGLGFYDAFRLQRHWRHHREAAAARGVEYDFTRFAPASVSDEENFAATPFFRELFAADEATLREMTDRLKLIPAGEGAIAPPGDWRKGERFDAAAWRAYLGTPDLYPFLKPHEALLDEISHAAARPGAVFPLEDHPHGVPALPHVSRMVDLARLYQLRGNVFLAENKPEKAFHDLQTIFHLSRHVGDHEPLLDTTVFQRSIFEMAVGLYWQGLVSGQWPDAVLPEIQKQLQTSDFLLNGRKVYQAERASYVSRVELLIANPTEAENRAPAYYEVYHDVESYLPFKGWLYQSLLQGDRFFEESLQPLLDPVARRVDAAKEQRLRDDLEALRKKPHASHLFILYSFHSLLNTAQHFAYMQTMADLGTVATALERYRRENGGYPETVETLAPVYLEAVPHDLVSGEPFHYRRTDDGRFLLYSVGWNGTDDGGKSRFSEQKHPLTVIPEGDWVWPVAVEQEGTPSP